MPDFEEIFGKAADEMTEGEFKIAVLGILHDICSQLKEINGRTKCVPRHEWFFRGILAVMGAGLIALLTYNIPKWFS